VVGKAYLRDGAVDLLLAEAQRGQLRLGHSHVDALGARAVDGGLERVGQRGQRAVHRRGRRHRLLQCGRRSAHLDTARDVLRSNSAARS
jgi:hypothetical protein